MKRTVIAVFALLGCALTSCSSDDGGGGSKQPEGSPEPTGLTVSGSMLVPLDPTEIIKVKNAVVGSTPCTAADGYTDVSEGAQVTVKDGSGDTVGIGSLNPGVLSAKKGDLLITANCEFSFAVQDVPEGGRFYSVEVAHSGEVIVSEAELDDPVVIHIWTN